MLLKHANACVNVLTVSFEPLSFNWFESLVGLVKLSERGDQWGDQWGGVGLQCCSAAVGPRLTGQNMKVE